MTTGCDWDWRTQILLHTEKIVLIDADGRIRGLYNGTQFFEIQKLLEDLKVLTAANGV